MLILWKYYSRGTLSDYLLNSEMRMDVNFKIAFLRDIINVSFYFFNLKFKGLEHLHSSPLGYHGNLSTMNCVIDSNFIVKIAAIGIEDLLEEWKRAGNISDYPEKSKSFSDNSQEQNKSEEISIDSNSYCKFFL